MAGPNPRRRPESSEIDTLGSTLIFAGLVGGAGLFIAINVQEQESNEKLCFEIAKELTGKERVDQETCKKLISLVEAEKEKMYREKTAKDVSKNLGIDDYKKLSRLIRKKIEQDDANKIKQKTPKPVNILGK